MLHRNPRRLPVRIVREMYYAIHNPLVKLYGRLVQPEVPGVKTFVFHQGKLLLVKIGYAHKGWVLPGGKIDRGEIPIIAATRETYEEAGVVLDNCQFLIKKRYEQPEKMIDLYYFYAEAKNDTVVIDCQEIVDADWFSLDALPSDLRPNLRLEIELIKEHMTTLNQ